MRICCPIIGAVVVLNRFSSDDLYRCFQQRASFETTIESRWQTNTGTDSCCRQRCGTPVSRRRVPTSSCNGVQLAELKRLVAQKLLQSSGTRSGVGAERVRFIAGGKEIQTDEALRQVDTNVKILCLLKPKGPCKDLLEIGNEEQVEEDNVDSLFMFAPWVPPACKAFCARFKIPEWVVAPLTRVKRKHWVLLTLWLITSHMLSRYDLGPVFILGTLFFLMFSNLGTRTGEYSAYSIFNRGVRRLPGQLTAEDLNRQMRPQ